MFNFLVILEGPSCSGNLKEVLSSFLNDPKRKVVGNLWNCRTFPSVPMQRWWERKAREIVLYLQWVHGLELYYIKRRLSQEIGFKWIQQFQSCGGFKGCVAVLLLLL